MKRTLGLALLMSWLGCASSAPQGTCDPKVQRCPGSSDAGVDLAQVAGEDFGVIDLMPTDLTPLKGFGDPCTDKSQCASGFCVFTGLSGVCSRLCPPDCPTGFGCFGVLGGGIDPGSVVDICVPENNQICSPCTMDSECSAAAKDLCLPGVVGGKFCARDCTTVACPNGYTCQNLTVSGIAVKQCVPNSGACDCKGPANLGMTAACSLTTPFGTCNGSRICNGATGWGACEPPSSSDVPDSNYADDNCDGIDGKYTDGIFVALSGTNNASCGKTHTTPCRTIGFGILRTLDESVRNVYVQAGDYNEVVTLQSGKNIYGGYDATWQRAARGTAGHIVRIIGGLESSEGEYMTIKARDVLATTTIADLLIVGPQVPFTAYGKSSYGVHASNARVTLQRVTIQAGEGGYGAPGSVGSNAPVTGAPTRANDGGPSDEFVTACNDSSRGGGGGAGTNSCAGAPDPNGGAGGRGGTMDNDCSFPPGFTARAGDAGGSAAVFATNSYGYRGYEGSGGDTCGFPGNGNPGLVQNGPAGGKGSGGAVNILGYWSASGGTSGGTGQHGTGGGGGGGSGGCDQGTDSYGAGGGGGGAGGCRAQSGGGGGGGAG
ncbi:MAG TPA: hypothetical protein VMZ28_04645, partial [Kofleriaceae bacterium]|nr:hypothetical protein [Kofleriaceae bacterium]